MTADAMLYVWGSYLTGLAMLLTEGMLLLLRSHAIRGHLGIHDRRLTRPPVDARAQRGVSPGHPDQ